MSNSKDISEERINASIGGELDATERNAIFEAWAGATALSQQVCELRQLSELVRHAYDRPPESEKYCKPEPRRMSMWGRAATATLLVGLGAMLGWSGHQPPPAALQADTGVQAMFWDKDRSFQNTDISKIAEQPGAKRVIVHLNTSSIAKFEQALDTAEQLLETYAFRAPGAEVELVTNASAIKMLRTGYSPYADRVRELQDRYLNLTFLACKDALDHVRELEDLETDVTLLPDVDVTPSALEHILNRLSEGWVYIKV